MPTMPKKGANLGVNSLSGLSASVDAMMKESGIGDVVEGKFVGLDAACSSLLTVPAGYRVG